jgi:hypothetical protein
MKPSLGRYLYGLAAIGAGACALTWHAFSTLGDLPHRAPLVLILGAVEVVGGLAVLGPRTVQIGAVAIGAVYLIFALLAVPAIIQHPLVYNSFGNFFEQFSFVSGAAILVACSGPPGQRARTRMARFAYYSFDACVVSFGLEQLFYLSATARLVPKWIPPGQLFWAIATTGAFGLAALALLTGLSARLAARLTTAMLLGFGLLVWLPALVADPHSFANWAEATETLGIAASAWLVADLLGLRPAGAAAARVE